MRQPNPYTPGFNQPPPVLAGREELLADVDEALEIAAFDHRTPRPMIFVGSRGVGKTVTLGEVALAAGRKLSWPTVHVEVTSDGSLLPMLTQRLLQTAELLAGEAPKRPGRPRKVRVSGGNVTAAGFGIGAEVKLEAVSDALTPAQQLEAAMTYTMELALERDAGLVVTLDEVHAVNRDEISILGAELQRRVPDNQPLVVVLAGLPSLRTHSGSKQWPTYFERAEWHELGQLDAADARRALTAPAAEADRPMTDAAAVHLLELCGGYPYAIQVTGHYAWRASTGNTQIDTEHAQAATPRIRADLDQLFSGRWQDASGKEREYLVAMVQAGTQTAPTGGEVAAQLGVPVTKVSYLRDRLIKKGTIYAAPDTTLHFITPQMGEWIRAHHLEGP